MPLCQHPADLHATDTHCHLERFTRPTDVLRRARTAHVRVVAVTSRPSDFRMLFPLFGRREGVRLALGLHPLEVARVQLESELRLFEAYVGHTSYVGEVGLDFSADGRASQTLQEQTFDRMLGIAGVSEKVLSVHSRRASKEVIAHLVAARASRVIMHWFSGPSRDLQAALDAGFYFSFNPKMLSSKGGRSTIAAVPRDRALLESDGPYARIGGRAAEPPDVLTVADFLAGEWGTSSNEALSTLERNLHRLCGGLPGVAI